MTFTYLGLANPREIVPMIPRPKYYLPNGREPMMEQLATHPLAASTTVTMREEALNDIFTIGLSIGLIRPKGIARQTFSEVLQQLKEEPTR